MRRGDCPLHTAVLIRAAQPGIGIVALPAVGNGETQQLLGDAEAELPPHAVAQGKIDGDQPQRGQPAEDEHALKEQHAAARPGRGEAAEIPATPPPATMTS